MSAPVQRPTHTRPHIDRIATLLQEDGRYRAEFLSLADLVQAAQLVEIDLDRVRLYGEVSYRDRSQAGTS